MQILHSHEARTENVKLRLKVLLVTPNKLNESLFHNKSKLKYAGSNSTMLESLPERMHVMF